MERQSRTSRLTIFAAVLGVTAILLVSCGEAKVDFNADVKPILNKRCISCHGGVKRNGNFSLLFRHEALDTTESGKPAIIPFNAAHSEMIRRLTLKDPEERMPYKEESLSEHEIDILRRWIDQGAEWGKHWAYVPVKSVDVPLTIMAAQSGSPPDAHFAQNEIDHFVLSKLAESQLAPSPPATKATLMRRVYLDLTGLPPTPEQAAKFLDNNHPDAYTQLVDTLLASPHFGEKWASWWLDLARYSDTKGYERDVGRNIWRYRDWVINAINDDMPFDQFTIEQLAGDLLPNPTDDQLIATAFHRNTMNNDEGGTEDEEFRVAALLDRVNTTWEVWQSTTMGCVQCHSHPYDPFVHKDYFRSLAFFNNTRDEDTHGEHPKLRVYDDQATAKVRAIRDWVKNIEGEREASAVTQFLKTLEPKYHPHDFDEFDNGELIDTKWLGVRHNGSARLKQINLTNKDYVLFPYLAFREGGILEIRADRRNGPLLARQALPATSGWKRKMLRVNLAKTEGVRDLYFLFRNPALNPGEVVADIEWFAFRREIPGKQFPGYQKVENDFAALLDLGVEGTPVMIENTPEQFRKTHIFERGNWLVRGEEVTPGVPEILNPFNGRYTPNRLGYAQWLVSPENPLTSRTVVNRIWEQLFGNGIVETLEDFGTQGAIPSHQELLDWLSHRLMHDHRWSLKLLIRDIVLSGTYRQDSKVRPDHLEKDPWNRLLARSPRIRLTAEQVRDQALAVSGLLSKKMYGKPVMPYQPQGIWNSVWSGEYWELSKDEDQYRRSLYTYSKRTSPYPAFMMFDGSTREVCVSRRIRTNTPLQALVTLNDSSHVIAARTLASVCTTTETTTPRQRINAMYKRILYTDMKPEKLAIMEELYSQALMSFKNANLAAQKYLARDTATPDNAALVVVAQALLNLDEVLNKE
jgi:hypothetical protein